MTRLVTAFIENWKPMGDIHWHKKRTEPFAPLWSLLALPVLVVGMYFLLPNTAYEQEMTLLLPAGNITEATRVDKRIFGYSAEGKPIEGYVIGSGETALFLFGSIHGNEMGTAELLETLVQEITKDPSIVPASKQLVIIPISNPDGYYDRIDKLNANGVNLNLNFPTDDWEQYGPEGLFAGNEPFSEIESRIIRDVVAKYDIDAMLSFHSQGVLVSPEYDDASIKLGKWYAAQTGYDYFDEWDYAGTATRWFEETYRKPAITVELTDHHKSDWEINREALMELVTSEGIPSQ